MRILDDVSAELWGGAGPVCEAQSNGCGPLLPGRTISMMTVFPTANCWYTEHGQIRLLVLMQLNKLFGESHTSQ